MSPSTPPPDTKQYLNSVKAVHLNIGWACVDKFKSKSAMAYSIHRAAIVYKENGDPEFTYQYYKIKNIKHVSVNGKHSSSPTGYGRMNVMLTTTNSHTCNAISELKHQGEYVLH